MKVASKLNSWSNSSIAAYISTVINCPTSTMEHLPLSARHQGRHRSIRSSHIACFCKSTSSKDRHSLTITIRTIWSNHNHKNNKKAHPPNLCLKTRQAQLTTTKDQGHRQVMPSNLPLSIPRFNSREIIRQSHQIWTTTLLTNKNDTRRSLRTISFKLFLFNYPIKF